MNIMPMAHVIQWGAQMAMYNGHKITLNDFQLSKAENRERKEILDG